MNLVLDKDLFEEEVGRANVLLVTSNSIVNRAGQLVMGRGAAREAARRWPKLPRMLADALRERGQVDGYYGILIPSQHPLDGITYLGALQVKRHWADAAETSLIEKSCWQLADMANRMPHFRLAINFPGIGNGHLDEALVRPIVDRLPENVWVYRRDL